MPDKFRYTEENPYVSNGGGRNSVKGKEYVGVEADVAEFEDLFEKKEIEHITTTGVDGLIEPLEHRVDFSVSDKDFEAISKWYLSVCEKRELLGNTNHLLYICKKA